MKLPDTPSSGSKIDGAWARQVVDYLRALTPRGPGVSVGANGTTIGETRNTSKARRRSSLSNSYLQLTRDAPPGFALPEGETRVPIFISYGLVGTLIPTGLFTVVAYIDPNAAGITYFFVKATLLETNPHLVTAAVFETTATFSEKVTPPFGDLGELPAHCYIPLGQVNVGADKSVTLYNTGNGSLVITAPMGGLSCSDEANPQVSKTISYHRANLNA